MKTIRIKATKKASHTRFIWLETTDSWPTRRKCIWMHHRLTTAKQQQRQTYGFVWALQGFLLLSVPLWFLGQKGRECQQPVSKCCCWWCCYACDRMGNETRIWYHERSQTDNTMGTNENCRELELGISSYWTNSQKGDNNLGTYSLYRKWIRKAYGDFTIRNIG